VVDLDEEKTSIEANLYYLRGLIIGIVFGFILAKLIEKQKSTSVVFNRDQQGNIVSITYV
jgi:uncharacterized membrane-anchored protein YhcB (DUF1043 family)